MCMCMCIYVCVNECIYMYKRERDKRLFEENLREKFILDIKSK